MKDPLFLPVIFVYLLYSNCYFTISESYAHYLTTDLCTRGFTKVATIYTQSSGINATGSITRLPYNGGEDCTIILRPPRGYGLILVVDNVNLRYKGSPRDCLDYLTILQETYDGFESRHKMKDCQINGLWYFRHMGQYRINFFANLSSSDFGSGFRLNYTTYEKEGQCWRSSKYFECWNGACIDKSLTCDNVNNCGENSDEWPDNKDCDGRNFFIDNPWAVGAGGCVLFAVVVLTILAFGFLRRRGRTTCVRTGPTVPYTTMGAPPQAITYGEQGMTNLQPHYGTPPPPYYSVPKS